MAAELNGDGWTPRLAGIARELSAMTQARLARAQAAGALDIAMVATDDGQREVKVMLALDGDVVLIAHDRDEDPAAALRMAFGGLTRDLEEALGEADRRRADREPVDEDLQRRLGEEVMPAALRIAHHEVALRQFMAELPVGALDPRDVADDALVTVLGAGGPARDSATLVHAIEEAVRARIADAVARQEAVGNDASLDGDAEERDLDGVSPLWDELRSFWVVDQALHLEDVMPDAAAKNPAEVVESKEVRHALVTALFDLPHDVRWVFGRVVSDGAAPADVAAATGLSVEVVVGRVEQACERLALKLFPAGDTDVAGVRELYTNLGGKLRHIATGR